MCLLIKTAIEVMASKETRPDIVPLLMEQCKAHGFSPFHVKKDSNGYIYNRCFTPRSPLCNFYSIKVEHVHSNS
jgi:3-hydroxyacyl-CoA dehydrogenase